MDKLATMFFGFLLKCGKSLKLSARVMLFTFITTCVGSTASVYVSYEINKYTLDQGVTELKTKNAIDSLKMDMTYRNTEELKESVKNLANRIDQLMLNSSISKGKNAHK